MVTGRTDTEATVLAEPVEVEYAGITCVAQLTYALHGTLPDGNDCKEESKRDDSVKYDRDQNVIRVTYSNREDIGYIHVIGLSATRWLVNLIPKSHEQNAHSTSSYPILPCIKTAIPIPNHVL